MNIASGLLEMAAQKIGESIFGFLLSFIPGGSAVAGAAGACCWQEPIVFKIGDEILAKVSNKGQQIH